MSGAHRHTHTLQSLANKNKTIEHMFAEATRASEVFFPRAFLCRPLSLLPYAKVRKQIAVRAMEKRMKILVRVTTAIWFFRICVVVRCFCCCLSTYNLNSHFACVCVCVCPSVTLFRSFPSTLTAFKPAKKANTYTYTSQVNWRNEQ